MGTRFKHVSPASTAVALLTLAATLTSTGSAQAAATRVRSGSSSDVSRASWQGPAFTMNGDGKIIPGSMSAAIDAIRGGTGSLDVVVLAGSAPTSGSTTPECDAAMALPGVNSCTTWTLTATADGSNSQVNSDIRNAEFVYFAGGDQCRYAAWKGSALEASVESVVAKGGGSGGGSAGHHINSPVVYDACKGSVTSAEALANPYDSYITFTTGMFDWANYSGVINDSHFTTRDRMGRTMAFVARAIKDGRTSGGKAWGVGVEEGTRCSSTRTEQPPSTERRPSWSWATTSRSRHHPASPQPSPTTRSGAWAPDRPTTSRTAPPAAITTAASQTESPAPTCTPALPRAPAHLPAARPPWPKPKRTTRAPPPTTPPPSPTPPHSRAA
ncbi:hypothetical protein ABZ667_09200 [Streptomyces lavendulae]|uniref:hypothetical protein n=1 Tax=Streptomyces lavendulae TaxID=1914 RepID=UPI0034031C3F